ncbi:Beta-barrel assembly machine subunit BamA [Loktanella fryxellensis]|uniref:Outer membrane protein assembly factor BamA n=1 Tax=Loktanella fryxellensis TaxID=245187 RepID=A0A1H8IBS4_9RHOB|nr:outer membrane protein assembly factor BamA [Loktanella fryxellensis]SEN66223.1 Beta-barrel assembly machine subunit BamA [Loktanella fryxellensis]
MTKTTWGALASGSTRTMRGLVAATAMGLVLQASAVLAQTQVFNAVQVSGNQRVATSTILTYAGIAQGEAVSADQLNAAGQNIRASGLFESVDVQAQGGTLAIAVVEFPTVNQISIEGNRRLRDAEFLPLIQSQPRRIYSPAVVERDTATITGLYAQNGRINASVTPRIIRLPDNRVDLVFEVRESGVTEVQRIGFVGNRSFSDRRLRGVLETKQAGLLRAIISRDTYSEERVGFDKQVLTDFYQSRGFADFTLQNVDVTLTRERDAFLITYNIQEGQQFTFGNVGASSALPEVDVDSFRRALTTRTGTSYSPGQVDRDIARLERLAIQQGLTFVAVEPVITRNDRDLSLNVDYQLVRGPRIFVERIDIEGNSTTLDRVVRNQFRTVEGDPFNPREIRQAADRIRALGFFSTAEVEAREGTTPDQVIVDVNVEEAPTGSLSFGANYNTDDGIGLVASFSEANFLGRGQGLSFQIGTGASNRRFEFGFSEPNFLDRDLRAGIDLSYRTTDNQNADYDTENFRVSPSLSFPLSESGRLSTFVAVSFADLTGEAEGISPFIQEEADGDAVTTTSLGYTYSFDNRRTGLDPTAGVVVRFGQEFGFGDTRFIKTTALAAAERRVLSEDVTLRATIEGGHLSYQEGSSRVTDRFFLNGNTFRGFEGNGVGPRDFQVDDDGNVTVDDALGGNSFAVARLEAEFPLGLPEEYGITGGVFADYGSVWDVGRDGPAGTDILYNDFTARATAGVSIFWTTPLGPLRFNFTEALLAEERDETKAFDVTISTAF